MPPEGKTQETAAYSACLFWLDRKCFPAFKSWKAAYGGSAGGFVYDPALTVSLEGTYTTDMSASLYGTQGKTYADYAPNYGYTGTPTITFEEIAPGFYNCSDLLAGWYAQVRGIGSRANMTGMVALNSDNTITLLSSYIAYWGDALDYINSSSFDPATGKLTYFASYAGQIFVTPVLYKN